MKPTTILLAIVSFAVALPNGLQPREDNDAACDTLAAIRVEFEQGFDHIDILKIKTATEKLDWELDCAAWDDTPSSPSEPCRVQSILEGTLLPPDWLGASVETLRNLRDSFALFAHNLECPGAVSRVLYFVCVD